MRPEPRLFQLLRTTNPGLTPRSPLPSLGPVHLKPRCHYPLLPFLPTCTLARILAAAGVRLADMATWRKATWLAKGSFAFAEPSGTGAALPQPAGLTKLTAPPWGLNLSLHITIGPPEDINCLELMEETYIKLGAPENLQKGNDTQTWTNVDKSRQT